MRFAFGYVSGGFEKCFLKGFRIPLANRAKNCSYCVSQVSFRHCDVADAWARLAIIAIIAIIGLVLILLIIVVSMIVIIVVIKLVIVSRSRLTQGGGGSCRRQGKSAAPRWARVW